MRGRVCKTEKLTDVTCGGGEGVEEVEGIEGGSWGLTARAAEVGLPIIFFDGSPEMIAVYGVVKGLG
jgi:hypothetical protein